jgi:hypothetical protein
LTDRAIQFLFSVVMILISLGTAVWLFLTGQHGFDGNFLLAVCLTVAFAFGLYLKFLLRGAREEIEAERKGAG